MTQPKSIEIDLTPPQLSAVRALLRGNTGQLSPFNVALTPPAQPLPPQHLAAAGLCDAAGNVQPGFAPLVHLLAHPLGMVRLLFTTEVGDGYESITYFDGQGRRASLANERGLTHLRLPDEAPATLELVAQHFGDSVLKSCDLDIELHPDLALVLAVAVDAQRRAFFQGLASGTEFGPVGLDPGYVTRALSAIPASTQWLTRVLAELLDRPRGIDPAQIPNAVQWLTQAGLLQPSGQVLVLAPSVLALSRRMLVFDRFLSVTACRLTPSDGLQVTDMTCVQAGVHDVLMVDSGSGMVHLKTTCSSYVLSLLTHLLMGGFLAPARTAA